MVIKLRLNASLLARFATDLPVVAKQEPSDTTTSAAPSVSTPKIKEDVSTPLPLPEGESVPTPSAKEEEGAATPTTKPAPKRKGPAPGSKRAPALDANGLPKARSKPGPKKRKYM